MPLKILDPVCVPSGTWVLCLQYWDSVGSWTSKLQVVCGVSEVKGLSTGDTIE